MTVLLKDESAAHTVMTLFVPGIPPLSHAFDYTKGDFSASPDLPAGTYACSLFVQVFDYKALGPMYKMSVFINGQLAATASGNIANGGSDSGLCKFTMSVL